ncbi:MAG: hypothetical protein Q7R47_05225 [Candidatus Diapherotrites archaeon]|nr:hypothetical protein [Candidatus Diapherotrites archaeon]
MVDKQIVMETIARMRESGISDKVIESTLSDIGMSKDEINEFLKPPTSGATVAPSGTSFKPKVPTPSEDADADPDTMADDDDPDSLTSNPFRSASAMPSPRMDPDEAMHSTTHVALEEHSQQLDVIVSKLADMDATLGKLRANGSFSPGDTFDKFDRRMGALENEVSDAKSQLAALRQIMDKLLETNRDILTELKGRK